MQMAIHISKLADVASSAEIEDEVFVGPFSVVGPNVRLGRGTRLENNVTVTGHTTLGEDNHIFPGVVIGGDPQDVSYRDRTRK